LSSGIGHDAFKADDPVEGSLEAEEGEADIGVFGIGIGENVFGDGDGVQEVAEFGVGGEVF
jgi:hypothetical protein